MLSPDVLEEAKQYIRFIDRQLRSCEELYRHSRNVALLFADVLAEEGRDDETVLAGAVAGLAHDAGMLKLPAYLRDKTRIYTREDWELAKRHPVNGYEMLPDTVLPGVDVMVLCHHRPRYPSEEVITDLLGRPLRTDEIGLIDRLTAVDQFTSILERRMYNGCRDTLTEDHVRRELEKSYTGSYDPERLLARFDDAVLRNLPRDFEYAGLDMETRGFRAHA